MNFLMLYRSGLMSYGWNFINSLTWMKWFVGQVGRTPEIPTSVLTVSLVLPLS